MAGKLFYRRIRFAKWCRINIQAACAAQKYTSLLSWGGGGWKSRAIYGDDDIQ